MEDTLRGSDFRAAQRTANVLILVLMEDTLREWMVHVILYIKISLNPCFNGRYSQRGMWMILS